MRRAAAARPIHQPNDDHTARARTVAAAPIHRVRRPVPGPRRLDRAHFSRFGVGRRCAGRGSRGAGVAHRGDPAAGGRRGAGGRGARRGGLAAGHAAHRLLAVSAGGRAAGGRGHRGPRLVCARRDLVRDRGPRQGAVGHPRHRGGPRQHRERRQHPSGHRHVPRPAPRLPVRREPARRAERRRPERGRGAGVEPHPRQHRPQSRLHLGVEGADH